MRIVTTEQYTPEWHALRRGLPTASQFHRLITKTGKPSASADGYMYELLAEVFIGEPVAGMDSPTGFMARGTGMEEEAKSWYEFSRGVDVQRVGLCVLDSGIAGASPDGLVGDDGAVEIKCPSAARHVQYLIEGLDDAYRVQAQGVLYVTGRAWLDLISYNPVLPRAVLRVERDEAFINTLAEIVEDFSVHLACGRITLAKLGAEPAPIERHEAETEILVGEQAEAGEDF